MALSRTRRPQHDLALAREIVDELLLDPPETPDEVHEALSGVDRRALADVVLEVVTADRLDPFDDDMFTEVARAADQKRVVDRLLDIAADQQAPTERRAVAWSIALHVDGKRAEARLAAIEPDIAMAASQRGLRVMLMRLEMFPDEFAPVIRDTLLGLDEEHRALMWMTYEVARAQLGTPAGLVYRDVVGHPGLTSLTDQLDAALDAVPDADAILAVERALDQARRDEDRVRLRKRLMRLRTAAAENPPRRPPARAWATGCDGQGAFLLHVEIERPNGDVLGGQLCLRTSGEMRSAWVEARTDGVDHGSIRAQMAEVVGPWLPIEPAAAAALVMHFVEQGHRVPDDALPGVALFRRLHRPGDLPPATVAPERAATFSSVSALLDAPPAKSWYLDSKDLETLGMRAPPIGQGKASIEIWRSRALTAAIEHGFPERWAAMADQLAWWLALEGRDEEASRMASAARATRTDPAGSPLVHAIVHHTVDVFAEPRPEIELPEMLWDDEDEDDEVWFEPPEGWRYDGWVGPDPEIWLKLDESTRIDGVAAWLTGPDGPSIPIGAGEVTRYAIMQTILETQLCVNDPPMIRSALTRLLRDGLDRADALLGLQMVLSTQFGGRLPPEQYVEDIATVARDGRVGVDRLLARGTSRRRKTVKRARNPKQASGRSRRKQSRKRRR